MFFLRNRRRFTGFKMRKCTTKSAWFTSTFITFAFDRTLILPIYKYPIQNIRRLAVTRMLLRYAFLIKYILLRCLLAQLVPYCPKTNVPAPQTPPTLRHLLGKSCRGRILHMWNGQRPMLTHEIRKRTRHKTHPLLIH